MPIEVPRTYSLPVYREGRRGGTRNETILELTGDVVSGGLNQSWIYTPAGETGGERYVLRVPRPANERQRTLTSLQREYDGIGATRNGIGFRIRTTADQVDFINNLQEANRKSVDYLDTQGDTMLLPFVEGIPLHNYLQNETNSTNIVNHVLVHLVDSHRNGIIFGDRWGPNTIVKPNGDFVELDYDIELLGKREDTTAFELAQFLYHAVHFSGERRAMTITGIQKLIGEDPSLLTSYDQEKLTTFLIGHAKYFYDRYANHGELYEGIRPPSYKEIFDLINAITPSDQPESTRTREEVPVFQTRPFAA